MNMSISHESSPQPEDPHDSELLNLFEQEFGNFYIDIKDQRAFLREARQRLDSALHPLRTWERVADAFPDLIRDAPWETHFHKTLRGDILLDVEYCSADSATSRPKRAALTVASFDDAGQPQTGTHFTEADVRALDSYFSYIDLAKSGGLLPDLGHNYRLPTL